MVDGVDILHVSVSIKKNEKMASKMHQNDQISTFYSLRRQGPKFPVAL